MFTNWGQVESWIRDNQFVHWIFTKSAPTDRDDKSNDKIVDSNAYAGDFEDKIAMTKKYLELNGGRAYGLAWDAPKTTVGGSTCEVRLEQEYAAPAGVGNTPANYPSIGEIRESITKEVRAQFELENMKRREEELNKREKELNDRENSAMGAVVKLLAPVGKAMMERAQYRNVAGVDVNEPIVVDPIRVRQEPQEQQAQEQKPEQPQTPSENESDFSEEEEAKIYDLMSRFKKVEPDYLSLIERVVEMAESGDSTYTMAKGFLVK